MTFPKGLRIAVFGLVVAFLATQARAIAITDLSIQTPGGGFDNPSASYLGKGNAQKKSINDLTGLFAGDPWTLLDRANKKASRPFHDVSFTLTADVRQSSGDWGLSWGDSELPLYMDFIILLKGEMQWAAYLFEAGSINSASGAVDGLFNMSWLTKKGKISKLRRATIYGRLAAAPVVPKDGPMGTVGGTTDGDGGTGPDNDPKDSGNDPTDFANGPTEPDPTPIPLPGSFALLLLGMGLGLRQLKQTRAQGITKSH